MKNKPTSLRSVQSIVCIVVACGVGQYVASASAAQHPLPGSIVISELMPNVSEADVDWIEFYNSTQAAVDLNGCTLTDDQNDELTFDRSLIIEPNSYAVIGSRKSEEANQPAALTNLAYQFSADDFQLSTGPDQVALNCNGVLVDRVVYQAYRPGPALSLIHLTVATTTNYRTGVTPGCRYCQMKTFMEKIKWPRQGALTPNAQRRHCLICILIINRPYLLTV